MDPKYRGWSLRIAINALLRENARLRRRLIAALKRIAQLEGK
jgi:hypothetical protein